MVGHKIIIIGAGIGGLMTAIALNKKGIRSVVYEREASFDPNGAGLALWANATGILKKFDLLDQLKQHGSVIKELNTFTWRGKLLGSLELSKLEKMCRYPSMVLLRSQLHEMLLNSLPVSQVNFKKNCIRTENKAGQVVFHFDDGTAEIADLAVFADGIHSYARKNIFELPPLQYAGRTSWRGVAQFDTPFFPVGINFEIFGKGKRIGIFPLPKNQAYWYAAVNMPLEQSFKQRRTIESATSHFKDWAEPVVSLLKNTPEEKLILTNINYAPKIKKLVINNNTALLGDAAHPLTPDLGQGACQAIEDAYVLADCIEKDKSIAESLKQYEQRRLQRVSTIARNSFRVGNMRQVGNPVGVAIRNNLFKYLPEKLVLKILAKNINVIS